MPPRNLHVCGQTSVPCGVRSPPSGGAPAAPTTPSWAPPSLPGPVPTHSPRAPGLRGSLQDVTATPVTSLRPVSSHTDLRPSQSLGHFVTRVASRELLLCVLRGPRRGHVQNGHRADHSVPEDSDARRPSPHRESPGPTSHLSLSHHRPPGVDRGQHTGPAGVHEGCGGPAPVTGALGVLHADDRWALELDTPLALLQDPWPLGQGDTGSPSPQ